MSEIKRDRINEIMTEMLTEVGKHSHPSHEFVRGLRVMHVPKVIELITKALSLNASWVRVEERLPEKYDSYVVLVNINRGADYMVAVSNFRAKIKEWDNYKNDVIAWLDNVPEFNEKP